MANKETEMAAGAAAFAFVRAATRAGVDPTHAVTLSAFGMIEGALGREASRQLGVPRSTLSRWRQELAAVAASGVADDPDFAVESINALLPSLGLRDLRMHRVAVDDQP